jgi:uncharacterized membrane protein
MDDRTLMLTLRAVHILGGVFWAGAAFLLTWFLMPAQRKLGRAAGPFIRELMIERKLSTWMTAAAGLTILSGLGMFWRLSSMSGGAFGASRQGMTLGIGAAAALLAAFVGSMWGGATAKKMARLGAQLEGASGPPDPALLAQIGTLQGRLALASRTAATLLVVATLAMALARYL